MAKFNPDMYLEQIESSTLELKRDPIAEGFQKFRDVKGNLLKVVCAVLERDHGINLKFTALHPDNLWRKGDIIYINFRAPGINEGITFEADSTTFALLEL